MYLILRYRFKGLLYSAGNNLLKPLISKGNKRLQSTKISVLWGVHVLFSCLFCWFSVFAAVSIVFADAEAAEVDGSQLSSSRHPFYISGFGRAETSSKQIRFKSQSVGNEGVNPDSTAAKFLIFSRPISISSFKVVLTSSQILSANIPLYLRHLKILI